MHRARTIRLAKAAIEHDSTPALISFNVEALALEHVTKLRTIAESLQLFFHEAASSIKVGLTEDPAGVSGKIKLPDGMTRERSSKRLRHFADKLQEAIDHDDRDAVEEALAELYPDQLPDAQRSAKAQLADAIRRGDKTAIRTGLGVAPGRDDQSHPLRARRPTGARRIANAICARGCSRRRRGRRAGTRARRVRRARVPRAGRAIRGAARASRSGGAGVRPDAEQRARGRTPHEHHERDDDALTLTNDAPRTRYSPPRPLPPSARPP